MAVNHSEASKIRAEGISVRLSDGKDYLLHFGFEALYILEEEFMDGMRDVVDTLSPPDPDKLPDPATLPKGPERTAAEKARAEAAKKNGWAPGRLKRIGAVLEAALIHNRPEGQSIETSRAFFRRRLEFHGIITYLDALIDAFNQAKPDVAGELDEEEPDPNAAGSPNGSPGNGSTTSSLSTSVAASASSGA